MSASAVIPPTNIDEPATDLLPALRNDLQIYPGPISTDGSPSWTLLDPLTNRFFRLGWLEYQQLKFWRSTSYQHFRQILSQRTGLAVPAEETRKLASFLENNQLVKVQQQTRVQALLGRYTASRQSLTSRLLMNYFFLRIPLIRPDDFLRRTLPWVRFSFQPGFALLMAVVGILGLFLTLRQWDQFQVTVSNYLSLAHLPWYLLVIACAKLLHEFGHAYSAKRHHCRVPHMGVAFMLCWPVLYTDTSDTWKLAAKNQRLQVGAAGVIVELWLAMLATLLWSLFPEGPIRGGLVVLASVAWVSSLLINLNPFMRFDGYYLLSDWLDVANLQSRAFALARWKLREYLFQFGEDPPERFNARMHTTLLLYGFATWLYRMVLYIGIAVLVYHTLFKAAGIALMIMELTMLVARPCFTELKVWWQRRQSIRWQRRNLISWLFISGLMAVLVIPWKSYVEAPAVLSAIAHTRIYPSAAARISELPVQLGQRVAAGDTLLVLKAPDLANKIATLEQRIASVQWEISHITESSQRLNRQRVMESELVTLLTQIKGYQHQQQQLSISAPFAGRIVAIAPGIHPGAWVSPTMSLLTLVDSRSAKVEAYLSESDLQRVTDRQAAVFYPRHDNLAAIRLAFKSADIGSSPTLQATYLASHLGGSIDTTTSAQGDLIPKTPVYRWEFQTLTGAPAITHERQGKIRLPANATSYFASFYQFVLAIFIRESGF